jgi:hypothetical protein
LLVRSQSTRMSPMDVPARITPELGVRIAGAEVTHLIAQLEPSLTAHQASLLHQLRLAAEALGAARALLVTGRSGSAAA